VSGWVALVVVVVVVGVGVMCNYEWRYQGKPNRTKTSQVRQCFVEVCR